MNRDEINQLKCVDQPDHTDEANHFYVCGTCGQAVDCRKLGDVFHHEEEGHEPLQIQ